MKLNKASQELADFQMKNKSIDLTNDALSSSNLIASLENKLAEKKVELATLKRKFLLSNAPEVIEVESLVDEIEKLITIERQLLVSPNGKNFNEKGILLNKLKSTLRPYYYNIRAKVDYYGHKFFCPICSAQLKYFLPLPDIFESQRKK